MIEYEIIATGSKGNAVVINDEILIDCGVPFKSLARYCNKLKIVLLTHEHGDHFNKTTIKTLAQERPTLRFGCPRWLVKKMLICDVDARCIDVYEPDNVFYPYSNGIGIEPFSLKHNVPNCGYKIMLNNGERMLYATDTNSMDNIVAANFDLYMIEANYTESDIVERIKAKQSLGEYCHEWNVLNNHLSREKADNWLYANMGPNSQYIYMHEHI